MTEAELREQNLLRDLERKDAKIRELEDEIASIEPSSLRDQIRTRDRLIEAYEQTIEAQKKILSSCRATAWTPVSVCMPDSDGRYIVTCQRGPHRWTLVSIFRKGEFELMGVKAWMPLPEPCKEV